MNDVTLSLLSAVPIGLGATLTFDLWGILLKRAFKVAPANICLVGRWLRHMAEGTFRHANITTAPRKRAECGVGWLAHYLIGVTFAITFMALAGQKWLEKPTLIPALLFGAVTVLAPFFIMQPALGFGLAAAATANPGQARARTLANHTAFGVGLYLFGLLVSRLLMLYA
jgi:hypothetical protein